MKTDVLNVSPKVITEIALGVQPPLDVLQKYDYTYEEAQEILANPVFQRRVQDERRQLEENDDIDRIFNRMCYRLLRDKMVSVAISGAMPPSELVKATDMLRKHAGLGDTVAEASAPKAIINLHIGGAGEPQGAIIDSTPDALDIRVPKHLTSRSDSSRNNELEHGVEDL